MQTFLNFSVYIRDEGLRDIFADHSLRLVLNLLEHKNIPVHYIRTQERRGVAFARRELFGSIKEEPYLLWLDDDMVIEPTSVQCLMAEIEANDKVGFVQGVKKELDPFRKYINDINSLNGESALPDRIRIYFGDAAFLLMRTEALMSINWDIITKYQVDGLGGEDVAMSLMISQNWEGWGITTARGWHVSPSVERWGWELHSDVLQVELLRGQVSPEILRKVFPHLSNFIPEK